MRNTFEVYVSFAAKILKQAMETALRGKENENSQEAVRATELC